MVRRTYTNFRLKDLTWWINLEASPNEIEDKQAIVCKNYNFEWNKLINSKSIYLKRENTDVGWVNWILIDGSTVYHTKGGSLYKDWVEQFSWLPDKKTHISIWLDYIFFTFEDWTELALYWDWATLTSFTWLGFPKYNIVYNWKLVFGWYWNDNIYFSKTGWPNTPSDILDFSAYSAGNQSVWWNSRGEITGFQIGENWLYTFKKNEIWYSNSENDTWTNFNFIFNKITSNWAINQYAIQEVWQEIFYFDWITNKVRRLGYEQNLTTLRDSAVSNEIDLLLSDHDWDLSSATMSYAYPNLKLFLPSNLVADGVNDLFFVYNVDRKSWSTETNKTCSVSSYWWLWGAYNWNIYQDDKGVGIVNTAISWEYQSKEYDMWDWVDFKKFSELEIIGKMNENMNLTVWIYVDWDLIEERAIEVEEWNVPTLWTNILWETTLGWNDDSILAVQFRERIDLFTSWQYIRFVINYNWLWVVEINNIHIRWKQDLSYNNFY